MQGYSGNMTVVPIRSCVGSLILDWAARGKALAYETCLTICLKSAWKQSLWRTLVNVDAQQRLPRVRSGSTASAGALAVRAGSLFEIGNCCYTTEERRCGVEKEGSGRRMGRPQWLA